MDFWEISLELLYLKSFLKVLPSSSEWTIYRKFVQYFKLFARGSHRILLESILYISKKVTLILMFSTIIYWTDHHVILQAWCQAILDTPVERHIIGIFHPQKTVKKLRTKRLQYTHSNFLLCILMRSARSLLMARYILYRRTI